jgi:hypothetical protein
MLAVGQRTLSGSVTISGSSLMLADASRILGGAVTLSGSSLMLASGTVLVAFVGYVELELWPRDFELELEERSFGLELWPRDFELELEER